MILRACNSHYSILTPVTHQTDEFRPFKFSFSFGGTTPGTISIPNSAKALLPCWAQWERTEGISYHKRGCRWVGGDCVDNDCLLKEARVEGSADVDIKGTPVDACSTWAGERGDDEDGKGDEGTYIDGDLLVVLVGVVGTIIVSESEPNFRTFPLVTEVRSISVSEELLTWVNLLRLEGPWMDIDVEELSRLLGEIVVGGLDIGVVKVVPVGVVVVASVSTCAFSDGGKALPSTAFDSRIVS